MIIGPTPDITQEHLAYPIPDIWVGGGVVPYSPTPADNERAAEAMEKLGLKGVVMGQADKIVDPIMNPCFRMECEDLWRRTQAIYRERGHSMPDDLEKSIVEGVPSTASLEAKGVLQAMRASHPRLVLRMLALARLEPPKWLKENTQHQLLQRLDDRLSGRHLGEGGE